MIDVWVFLGIIGVDLMFVGTIAIALIQTIRERKEKNDTGNRID